MHETIEKTWAEADALVGEHLACDEVGRLTDRTVELLRATGGMRLLQTAEHGGYEAHPTVFCEWIRTVANLNPAAGWVGGVVGVHPWEIALCDPRLADEIYGDDPDTWVASPYVPRGRAIPEDDGLRLRGQWSYSTGTDHCDWVVLGGIVTDADGNMSAPPDVRHFFLPRGDYEIVPDSWNVLGLMGTGSKDVIVDGAIVPDYRALDQFALLRGELASERQPGKPLYAMPFAAIFSVAIAASILGIAEGLLRVYRDYLRERISGFGVVGRTDPFQQRALGEAEADVASAVAHLDVMVSRMFDDVADGKIIDKAQRLEFRRNQVRLVARVLESIDKLMSQSGTAATWKGQPIEQYWRDLRTAGTHVCVATDTVYTSWANHFFETGGPVNTFH